MIPFIAPTVCLLAGVLIGLRVNASRLATLREKLRRVEDRLDAYNLNALATDHDVAGVATPPSNTVELFDEDALAELRGQADQVRAYEAVRLCNNCDEHALFAWEDDGVPFAACNYCVSLWFNDGLPDWVERLERAS